MSENSAQGAEPVSFSEKLASSQAFAGLFREGMALVEETAGYLDGDGPAGIPRSSSAPRRSPTRPRACG